MRKIRNCLKNCSLLIGKIFSKLSVYKFSKIYSIRLNITIDFSNYDQGFLRQYLVFRKNDDFYKGAAFTTFPVSNIKNSQVDIRYLCVYIIFVK